MSAERAPRVLVVDRGRDVAALLGDAWADDEGPEIHHLARTTRLLDVLASGGPWDVVVAGPSEEAGTGLRRLAEARAAWPRLGLLVVGEERGATDAQSLVRAKPDELLRLPVTPAVLRASVEQVLAARPPEAVAGRVTVVLGASGGGGRTTTAVALAHLLAEAGQRTVLVDLDLQFGKAATALRLRPARTLAELLFDERGRPHDPVAVAESLTALDADDGEFALLAAPRDPVDADRIGDEDIGVVLRLLREHVDHVVVDTHAGLGPAALAALDLADDVVAVSAVDVPAVVALRELLALLDQLGVPEARRHVLLTKDLPGSGLPGADAAALLGRPVAAVVPHDPAAVAALNDGRPLTTGASPAALAVRQGLARIAPLRAPAAEPAAAPRGPLERVRAWIDAVHLTVAEDRS